MASTAPIPPSFSHDTILPPKLDTEVGPKSHFFRPPSTSASSSLHTSTASFHPKNVHQSTTSRKRSRHESHGSHSSDQATIFNPQSHASPTWHSSMPSALESPTSLSPLPFANTQYRLAGGLDTPTARLAMDDELREDPMSPDLHVRGGRSRAFLSAPDSYFPQAPSALSRESNGRPRKDPSPRVQEGLGKAVYGMVSVAGKVWDFCRTTAFKVRTPSRCSFLCRTEAFVIKNRCSDGRTEAHFTPKKWG